ncbi:MAG TPA: putative toxin-antitoxin system toxin component, PIN family [Pseudacidobacterium sp.]|nr:putative toxin-antitoxin system toxin component, PIN family [Pseudacidobacterium sp.]
MEPSGTAKVKRLYPVVAVEINPRYGWAVQNAPHPPPDCLKPIWEEYQSLLARPELRIRKEVRQQLLQLIKKHSHTVLPQRKLAIARDPDDNIFLECADAARADYLMTGNQKHSPKFWKSTKVVTPREFISIAAPHLMG